ncbi:MAG TPA: T9SS type A sorting domain-containing protein [Bacteroidia bacterium]|nr:T9SS type A sorting domain-containing protein [Bacteroidia bacterium]
MKKILLIGLLFAGLKANSQTLEHTYNNAGISIAKTSDTEFVYYGYDEPTKTVRIYDSGHSLIKTIVLNTTDGSTAIGNVSRKLFNLDNQFEILVYNNTAPNYVKIYDESGNAFFTKPTTSLSYPVVINTTSGTKMIIRDYIINGTTVINTSYVYSLAGTLQGIKPVDELESTKSLAYPNPTNDLILIPSSANSTIEVYNTTGILIDKYISNGYSTYNAAKLPSGMYIYKIDGTESGNFIKQ